MVVYQGMTPVIVGLAAGVVTSIFAGRLIGSLLLALDLMYDYRVYQDVADVCDAKLAKHVCTWKRRVASFRLAHQSGRRAGKW
jgi:hypothetical protein